MNADSVISGWKPSDQAPIDLDCESACRVLPSTVLHLQSPFIILLSPKTDILPSHRGRWLSRLRKKEGYLVQKNTAEAYSDYVIH